MSARPKVGFLGLGWIGLARLDALRESERVEVAALCDSDPEALRKGIERAPEARTSTRYEDMLEVDLDALVIATPSALHARQCIAAFERGLAVFCQKPLARTARETRAVLDAARTHDRLLRVDFCYRHTEALSRTREVVRSGELGIPFAAELVFHNAYGPDNRWAQDPALAGGGCLMDLGVHLIDALLWIFDFPSVEDAALHLFRAGTPLRPAAESVEDFATGLVKLRGGPSATLACSWRSSFGEPARIRIWIAGSRGSVAFENVEGSFYDFRCERYFGTSRKSLVVPPDSWGGRAIVAWADELRESPRYRPTTELLAVSEALDVLYGRGGSGPETRDDRFAEASGAP